MADKNLDETEAECDKLKAQADELRLSTLDGPNPPSAGPSAEASAAAGVAPGCTNLHLSPNLHVPFFR